MPVAPGVGKVRAHATPGKVNIRYDSVRGPSAETLFERLLGFDPARAEELAKRAWEQGSTFREYTPEPPKGEAEAQEAAPRVVKRLDIGERVSVLAVESQAGGSLGRALPLYWTDLTHTCEPNWAKRFSDHLGAWVEGNVDSPTGSEPLGFQALDFAWHAGVYLRGAAMPLEIAAVGETFRGVPAPKEEAVRSVVYPGGRASEPDEFDLLGTVLDVAEAKFEGGTGYILKLQVGPIEWIDLWLRSSKLARLPRPGEGVESRARLFGLWAGQRTSDLSVG
jgi:hypothetical protein